MALLLAALALAFVNGANDNSKGVATLFGSGVLNRHQALGLASAATAAGGLLSTVLAGALSAAFSGRGLVPAEVLTPGFLLAVALAATGSVGFATVAGLPVSTTHALVGGIVGAGLVTAGPALRIDAIGSSFFLPLALGPCVAAALTAAAWLGRGPERAHGPRTEPRPSRPDLVDRLHTASGALVCFARGLNDAPKISGLLAGMAVAPVALAAPLVVAAMILGGLFAGRRVLDTLAWRVTALSPVAGLRVNSVAALLVAGGAHLGWPLSTTHVVGGGLFGIGAAQGTLRGRAVAEIGLAWVTTLPLSALLAAVLAAVLG